MSSTMVGNGYQQNYNTYNGQPPPDQGQNVITSGVVSNSDEYRQRLREILGSQRQKEYNRFLQKEGYYDPHPSSRPPANEYYGSSTSQPQSVQTSPRRGVYYRLASPEVGLPLGRYEEQRKSLDEQRQRDYFAMMSQKEQKEQQKRQEEKLKKQAHTQVLQKHQAQQKLYNYDEVQRKLREERRKDYDEFVPMGGIPRRGKYDPVLHSQTLAEQKYREYLRNQLSEEESDSSDDSDINDHSNRRKSRHSKDDEEDQHSPLPWDNYLFEGKHTDEFLARGGIPRRRKQKYTRKSGRAKERKNEYMAFLQSKLLEVQKHIESQMKELQNQSGEEVENTTDEQDGQNKRMHTLANKEKKLSKRKDVQKNLLVHQRGLQTPPWAEHFDMEEIKTTEKIGHQSNKSIGLSEETGNIDNHPRNQNHKINSKVTEVEKKTNRNRHSHERYEPSQPTQSESRLRTSNKKDFEDSGGRHRFQYNQTDEVKLNSYQPERQMQEYVTGNYENDLYPKGHQNGSLPVQESQNGSLPVQEGHQNGYYPEKKGQRSDTRESESHLWNNSRRKQYDKIHPWNNQYSQDLSSADFEKQIKNQDQHRENKTLHPSRQGDHRHSRGHVDKGQRCEGHQDLQKYNDQKRGNVSQSQERTIENQSSRGQWDKTQWDEDQLSKDHLEKNQKDENYQGNEKVEDDFMPFGGMLRRRKVDPTTLRAEFLKETRRNYNELTMKMKEEQAKIKEPATPPGGLDVGQYELYRKRLKEDLVNDYKSSLLQQQTEKMQFQLAKAQQEYSNIPLGPAVSPLPVKHVELFNPETQKQQLRGDRHREYNEFLHEKEQKPSPRRMPTPPNGLDIVTQDERTRQAREKQRLYGQELQKQSQQQMLQKIQNNIAVIDRTGQQAAIPNQYNQVPPQQHSMPPPQQHASPPSRNVAPNPPPQSSSPPPPAPQHAQMLPPQQHQSQMRTPQIHNNQMQNFQREHHQATPAGSQSPPPRQRNHPTPQVADQGHYAEFNGKQQSPVDSRDGHRPPPHPRRYTTPDRLDWARGPPRQNGTSTGRSSHRRDDRQTPSYWNGGIPVKSPATTPSTRTPSTQHSNRTLTPKDSQENPPDIYLESYRRNPIKDLRQQERNREYKHFLSEEEMKAQQKKEKLETLRRQPAVQPKYDNYSSSDNHQRYQKNLNNERRDQYQSFLSQNGEPVYAYTRNPSSDLALSRLSGGLVGGIFGDVQHEKERRQAMEHQRNKEYNDLKKKNNSREPSNEFNRNPPQFGLPLDNVKSNEKRRQQENIRNREYRDLLEKQSNSRQPSHEFDRKRPEFGLPLDNRRSNEMHRKQERDRNQEYNDFLKTQNHSPRRFHPPTPEDKQGLPLTQKPYDEKKALSERQRNMEYNQYLAKSGLPFDKMSLNGSVHQSAVSRKENVYHSAKEPRSPQKRYPSKKNDREVEHRVEEEKKLPHKTVRHIPSGGSRPDVDVNFESQKAFPMGNDYAAKQKKLKEEWRMSYESMKDKFKKKSYTPQVKIQITKDDDARSKREGSFRESWERSMESPPIVPAGSYDLKREKIRAGLQADYQVYLASQQPANRSKEFWGSNDNPKIYPTSGEYKKRGEKMKEELREEFHHFMEKQEPPKERKKVFGDQGSVLFVSEYPDTKKHMNAVRKKEMIEHLEKKKGEVHRRQGDPSMDEKNMFSDMGKSQEAQRQRVREDAKQNYNNYIDHAFPEGLERGQPSFATRIPLPDSWYTAQPPTHRRSPPRDYRPEQERSSDLYAGRLEQARANEAMYRRNDHEMNGQRPPPPRQEAPYALH